MKYNVLTLFPEMFTGFKNESIIKKTIEKELCEIEIVNIRDFSNNKHKQVDDEPYGGNGGMLLKVEPVVSAIESCKQDGGKVVLMSPQGIRFNQQVAEELVKEEQIVLVCGHYEGFDERIRTYVDMEVSIGDYVLTGGELASMVIMDSTIRLLDGAITAASHQNDSFQKPLLEHPHYTRPREFRGMQVPDVLLSGHHAKIEEWREYQSLKRTYERRPDLINEDELTTVQKNWLNEIKEGC
jgi:tRNA (guanine37-N1)-methyltransferase